MKYTFLAILLLMLTANGAIGQVPAKTIPAFTFSRLDGKAFTNKDLPAGKKIFFVFFDPDCDHCQHGVKIIGEQFQAFKKVAVIMVSMFDESRINQFMDTYGKALKGQKNVLVLRDKAGRFISTFKPDKYPSMFLYAANKKLLAYEDTPENIPRIIKLLKDK